MATIVCFSDDATFGATVRQNLADDHFEVYVLPASRLSQELRETVRRLAPAIVLMEMTPALDNLPLFFFLRSDDTTRETPVIMLSSQKRHQQQATMLGADAFVLRLQLPELLRGTVERHALRETAIAA